jgi:hypothetical protein
MAEQASSTDCQMHLSVPLVQFLVPSPKRHSRNTINARGLDETLYATEAQRRALFQHNARAAYGLGV